MKVSFLHRANNYIKTGALATMLTWGGCSQKAPVVFKKEMPYEYLTTVKLLEKLEQGTIQAKIVYAENAPRVISANDISKYKVVPAFILKTLKELPDTMELYFRVYKGKADDAIQKALGKKQNLVTVGQGITGRGYIQLANNEKAQLNDYISQYAADSLLNCAVIKKDSILRANIDSKVYKKLKSNEKDAIRAYLHNVSEVLLKKRDSARKIPESFFDCLNSGDLAKVQAKFNVVPSAPSVATGLAKRNLVEMIVFGDGKIYQEKNALETFYNSLNIIKKREDSDKLIAEILDTARTYGVNAKKLAKTEKQINLYLEK